MSSRNSLRPSEKRSKTIRVMVTQEQHEQIQEAARRAGYSVSTWMSMNATGIPKTKVNTPAKEKLFPRTRIFGWGTLGTLEKIGKRLGGTRCFIKYEDGSEKMGPLRASYREAFEDFYTLTGTPKRDRKKA